jgi:ATPase subunit of ABC transporter with duplicated ATPase domains
MKSLATAAASLVLATLALAPAAQAGGCHHGGGFGGGYGGGYSSYQSYPSHNYRAERQAEARAAAARRAKLAAIRAEKTRVAKAEARADAKAEAVKTADANTEPRPVTNSIAKVTDKTETTVAVASAEPTCSKFVPAIGTTVTVACGPK